MIAVVIDRTFKAGALAGFAAFRRMNACRDLVLPRRQM
jgi:hypothetical protein